jgi:hypothetical protein
MPGDLYYSSFTMRILIAKGLGSGTYGQLYFLLPRITNRMYIQKLREEILIHIENVVEICKQLPAVILYQVIYMLVTLLEFHLFLYMSPFILLLCIASSLIVSFRYFRFSLKCLPSLNLTLFKLSQFICTRSCHHCKLACLLCSYSSEHSSPNRGLRCFSP